MKLFVYILFFIMVICNQTYAASEDEKLQYFHIDVADAVRPTHKGITDKSIHFFKLYCGVGSCSLDRLILNDCETDKSNNINGFTPRIDNWVTWVGTLKVKLVDDNTLEVLVYQTFHQGFPAKLKYKLMPDAPASLRTKRRINWKSQLLSASGFLNYKVFPIIETIDYEVISPATSYVPIDCPVKAHW